MDFVNSLGIVKRYSKIGVRYVNIFNDDNILDNVYLKTNILGKNGEYDSRTIRAEFSSDDYKVIVQLNHKVKLKSTEKFVSLFDIDVIKMIDTEITFDKLLEEINVIRQKEKEVFFKIVKEDFIEKKFNPEF